MRLHLVVAKHILEGEASGSSSSQDLVQLNKELQIVDEIRLLVACLNPEFSFNLECPLVFYQFARFLRFCFLR